MGREPPGLAPVVRPAAAGGDDDDAGAVVEDVRRGQASSGDHLDVGQLVELGAPPVGHASPVAERRKPPRPADATADLVLGIHEMDRREAASAEHQRALHAGRPRPHDEHGAVRVGRGLEPLRVPAATELLARSGVLDAAHVPEGLLLHDADVRPRALADVAEPALGDLAREERIGDRRSGRTDQVEGAGADHGGHLVGVGVPADADDGLRRRLADPARPGQLVALGVVAGGPGVLGPRAHRHVEQVDQRVRQCHELEHLLDEDALDPAPAVDADAGGDGAVVTDRVAHLLEGLERESGPSGEGAPVPVRPAVAPGGQELREQVAVRPVHVDDVEAGVSCEAGARDEVRLHPGDVVARHLPRSGPPPHGSRGCARCDARMPRRDVLAGVAAVVQLHPGQCPVRVDGVSGRGRGQRRRGRRAGRPPHAVTRRRPLRRVRTRRTPLPSRPRP